MKQQRLLAVFAAAAVLLAACSSSKDETKSSATTAPTTAPAQAQATTAAAPAATARAAATTAATAAAAQAQATTAATTAPAQAQAATPAANPIERVNGTIRSIDGNKVTLAEGGSFTLSPQTAVTRRTAGTASSFQPGQVVAVTAKRQPDNTLMASIINVFQVPPNGFPMGQRPMDQGNLMTNATIDKLETGGFTVTFPDGGARVKLAPDVQITLLTVGEMTDVKVGANISAAVRDGVAQQVSVQGAVQ